MPCPEWLGDLGADGGNADEECDVGLEVGMSIEVIVDRLLQPGQRRLQEGNTVSQ